MLSNTTMQRFIEAMRQIGASSASGSANTTTAASGAGGLAAANNVTAAQEIITAINGGSGGLPLTGGTMSGPINMGAQDISNAARVAQGITVHTLFDAQTFNLQDNQPFVAMNGSVSTQTVVMPPTPIIGQVVKMTVLSGGITTLTLSTVDGSNFFPAAPTAMAAGAWIEYAYVVLGPNKFWVRLSGSI